MILDVTRHFGGGFSSDRFDPTPVRRLESLSSLGAPTKTASCHLPHLPHLLWALPPLQQLQDGSREPLDRSSKRSFNRFNSGGFGVLGTNPSETPEITPGIQVPPQKVIGDRRYLDPEGMDTCRRVARMSMGVFRVLGMSGWCEALLQPQRTSSKLSPQTPHSDLRTHSALATASIPSW